MKLPIIIGFISAIIMSAGFDPCNPEGDCPNVSIRTLERYPYEYENKVVKITGHLSVKGGALIYDDKGLLVLKSGEEGNACMSCQVCNDKKYDKLMQIYTEQGSLNLLLKIPERDYEVTLIGKLCLRKDKDGIITTIIEPYADKYPLEFIYFKVEKIVDLGIVKEKE